MHNDIAPHIQVFYLAFQISNSVQPQLIFDCSIKTNQTLKHFLTKLATSIYCCFCHNSLITLKSFHFESTPLAITGHTTHYGNRIAEQQPRPRLGSWPCLPCLTNPDCKPREHLGSLTVSIPSEPPGAASRCILTCLQPASSPFSC